MYLYLDIQFIAYLICNRKVKFSQISYSLDIAKTARFSDVQSMGFAVLWEHAHLFSLAVLEKVKAELHVFIRRSFSSTEFVDVSRNILVNFNQ